MRAIKEVTERQSDYIHNRLQYKTEYFYKHIAYHCINTIRETAFNDNYMILILYTAAKAESASDLKKQKQNIAIKRIS